jgi:hypothetical protein
MVAFAFLGNTLFLTILVSMLSTTFATIVSNATAEIQFRRAVLTLEGVKSDAIFAYQPPFNILALIVLIPLKFVLTPRWFHKINVAAVRTLNAPLLLIIGIVERRTLWAGTRRQRDAEHLPKSHSRANLWDFSRGFSVHGDIQAVFDAEPPQSIEDEISNEDDLSHHELEDDYALEFGPESSKPKLQRTNTAKTTKSRRDSVYPFANVRDQLRDMMKDESEDGDGDDVKSRLEALEKSTLRIEEMLGRLCEDIDDGTRKSRSVHGGETGTLQDLDRSGTADIDD